MKYLKIGNRIIIAGFIFFIIYNTWFGWNLQPESKMEEYMDTLFGWLVTVGLCFYFYPLIKIYERRVKRWEEDEKRDKFNREVIDAKKEFEQRNWASGFDPHEQTE